MLGVGGQQRDRHRPGTRDGGREIRVRRLLAEQLMGVLREPGEVLFDTLTGIGEVGGRMPEGDGQVAERPCQPSGLLGPPVILRRGEPESLV